MALAKSAVLRLKIRRTSHAQSNLQENGKVNFLSRSLVLLQSAIGGRQTVGETRMMDSVNGLTDLSTSRPTCAIFQTGV